MADSDQLKMEELDHEAYESENLQDTNDFSADNGATDGDSMMEDPVSFETCLLVYLFSV